MYHLWDMVEESKVGEFATAEEAYRHIGAMMSFVGPATLRDRYELTLKPNKKRYATQAVSREEFFSQALRYFDRHILERRINHRLGMTHDNPTSGLVTG